LTDTVSDDESVGSSGGDAQRDTDPLFVVADVHDVGGHHLRVLVPSGPEGWLEELAAEYRRLRTSSRLPPRPLSFEGVDVLSVAEVEVMLAESCVPQYEPGNFGVARSDLAEIILGLVQETEYGCRYGYRSIRDRETRQRPGRGIDLIGVEGSVDVAGPELTLVLGEGKVSTDRRSPPAVVDSANDCLREQHLNHLADRKSTYAKVVDASRNADDPQVQAALRVAALLLQRSDPRLRIVAASAMVRPEGTEVPSDFGTFHSSVDDYAPANIRFLLIRLPGDIDELAQRLAQLAARAESGGQQ
jgi:hypothetical protein